MNLASIGRYLFMIPNGHFGLFHFMSGLTWLAWFLAGCQEAFLGLLDGSWLASSSGSLLYEEKGKN